MRTAVLLGLGIAMALGGLSASAEAEAMAAGGGTTEMVGLALEVAENPAGADHGGAITEVSGADDVVTDSADGVDGAGFAGGDAPLPGPAEQGDGAIVAEAGPLVGVDDGDGPVVLTAQGETDAVASGTWGECDWSIGAAGTLRIVPSDGVSGRLADSRGWSQDDVEAYFPWYEYRVRIRDAELADGVFLPGDCSGMFYGCSSLVTLDASRWDTSNVQNMSYMFYGCSYLESLYTSGWNTSRVTNMHLMFCRCSDLYILDVSGWDTSSVEDMSGMFCECFSLATLDVSGWDTSSVESMSDMFCECFSLTTLDVSGWDTSHVTRMGGIFSGCGKLAALDVSGWDTSSVTDMGSMFNCCSSLVSLDVSGWDTSRVTRMHDMFIGCSSLAEFKVGKLYVVNAHMFPRPTATNGMWWSMGAGSWLAMNDIVASRSAMADAYYNEAKTIDISSAIVTAANQTYTGLALTPAPTVTLGGRTLTRGTDYIIEYVKNVDVGTATVTVTGVHGYEGTVTGTFAIVKAANPITTRATVTSVSATYDPSAVNATAVNVTVRGAVGAVTYANVSTTEVTRGFAVDTVTGEVMLPKATRAVTYTVKVRVTAAGNKNYRAGSKVVSYKIVVNKAANPMTAKSTKASLSATYDPKAATVTPKNVGTSGKVGALSYENASADATARGFAVDPATGEVTLPKATRAGTYDVRVKVTAAGNKNYKVGSKTVSYKMVVNKATNPMTLAPATRTASFETLRTRAVTVTKPLAVSGSIGTKTYARAQNSNYFTVDESTGRVTIKKGTPKGTYTLKVRVTAAGGPNYEAGSKVVTGKITVR